MLLKILIELLSVTAAAESSSKRKVQFEEKVEVKTIEKEPELVQIDEAKLNECLQMLQDADPTGERLDPEDLKPLEGEII